MKNKRLWSLEAVNSRDQSKIQAPMMNTIPTTLTLEEIRVAMLGEQVVIQEVTSGTLIKASKTMTLILEPQTNQVNLKHNKNKKTWWDLTSLHLHLILNPFLIIQAQPISLEEEVQLLPQEALISLEEEELAQLPLEQLLLCSQLSPNNQHNLRDQDSNPILEIHLEAQDSFRQLLQEGDMEWEEDSSSSKTHSKLDSLEAIWEDRWEDTWEVPWVAAWAWVEEWEWEEECNNKIHLEEPLNKIHSKRTCQWEVAWVWEVDLAIIVVVVVVIRD